MREEIKQTLEECLPIVDLESDFLFSELDSLSITTILMVLSEKYGITLESKDATPRNFQSLDSIVRMVQSKLS
ncbi:MAG: acyl carrier protein [Bacteroidales bacterium]|nr:acyl carrier protein [Bacteroidales bacterium]